MSVDPGGGYRLLKEGELILDGDEFFSFNSQRWHSDTMMVGAKLGRISDDGFYPRRRKIEDIDPSGGYCCGEEDKAIAVPGKCQLSDRMTAAIRALPQRALPFAEILCEAMELHASKSKDYGSDADPYANIRASEEFGIASWHGALMRSNDKITRLKQFAKKGVLANESAADSMLDLVVYFAITLMLYREAK